MRMSLDSCDSLVTAWKSPRKSAAADDDSSHSPLKLSEERYSLRSRAQKEHQSPEKVRLPPNPKTPRLDLSVKWRLGLRPASANMGMLGYSRSGVLGTVHCLAVLNRQLSSFRVASRVYTTSALKLPWQQWWYRLGPIYQAS